MSLDLALRDIGVAAQSCSLSGLKRTFNSQAEFDASVEMIQLQHQPALHVAVAKPVRPIKALV